MPLEDPWPALWHRPSFNKYCSYIHPLYSLIRMIVRIDSCNARSICRPVFFHQANAIVRPATSFTANRLDHHNFFSTDKIRFPYGSFHVLSSCLCVCAGHSPRIHHYYCSSPSFSPITSSRLYRSAVAFMAAKYFCK